MKKLFAFILCSIFILSIVSVSFAAGKSTVNFTLKADGKFVKNATFIVTKEGSTKPVATVKIVNGKASIKLPAGKYQVITSGSKLPKGCYWGLVANCMGSPCCFFTVKAGKTATIKLTCHKK